jgi:hypothetical protein
MKVIVIYRGHWSFILISMYSARQITDYCVVAYSVQVLRVFSRITRVVIVVEYEYVLASSSTYTVYSLKIEWNFKKPYFHFLLAELDPFRALSPDYFPVLNNIWISTTLPPKPCIELSMTTLSSWTQKTIILFKGSS